MGRLDWLTVDPFAHRGLHNADIPENSLAAFKAAVASGYGMELDVRLSADGVAVVFHDATLQRLCDRADNVSDLNADELTRCSLAGGDHTIPTLASVLDLVDGQTPLLVEVKSRGDIGPLEDAVRRELAAYGGDFAVISFEPNSIAWFCRHVPEFPRGWTACKRDRARAFVPTLDRFRQSRFIDAYGAVPDFYVYNHRDLPYWPVEQIRAEEKCVLVYTVENEAEAARAAGFADNIIFEGFRP